MGIVDDCIAGFTTYLAAHTPSFPIWLINLRKDDVKLYADSIGFDSLNERKTLETFDLMYEHNEVVVCLIRGNTPANKSAIISVFLSAFPSCLDGYTNNSGWWEYTETQLKDTVIQEEEVFFIRRVYYQ